MNISDTPGFNKDHYKTVWIPVTGPAPVHQQDVPKFLPLQKLPVNLGSQNPQLQSKQPMNFPPQLQPDPQKDREPSPEVEILKVVSAVPEPSSRPKLTRKPRHPRITSPPSRLPEVCPKSLDAPVSALDLHQLPPQNFEQQLQQHFYCATQSFQNSQNQKMHLTRFPQNPSEAPHLLQNLQLELLSLPTIFLFPPKSLEQLFLLIHTNLRLKNTCIENTLQLIDCKRRATIHVENHFKLHMSKIGVMRKLMEKNQGVEEWVFIEYYLDYHRIKLGTSPDMDLSLFERFMVEKIAGYIFGGGGGKKQRQQEFLMGADGLLKAGQPGESSQNQVENGRRIDQGEVVLELDKLTRLKEQENIKKWKEYFYKIEVDKLNIITKNLREIPGKREVLERKEQVALKGLKCYRNILDQAFKHLKELEESVPVLEKEFEEQKKKVMEALEEADLATKDYNEAKEEFENSGKK
ncbi:hypothetical protein CAEBREN_14386 [Caenorhabditis brenneri]|uniref:Uncharacterized protein n=1 Tax=Caenorhabditis brenneri TaxID=135651 RepID=G0MCP3_CAEBE|nr:hypothetical protein CAEBREN_14386 [Caenorhabditis brenneri]